MLNESRVGARRIPAAFPVFSLSRAAAFGVMALLFAVAGAQQASAQYGSGISDGVLECRNALNASAAERHCPALRAHRTPTVVSAGPVDTCFVWGSCTLTVPVGDTDTSFHSNVRHNEDSVVYGSPSDIRLLDFCFSTADDADEAQGGWEMSLKAGGCTGDEIDADTAIADGLEAQDQQQE